MSKNFGLLLKEKRQQKNFTMRSFAEKILISPVILSKFESNQRIPSDKLMVLMAEALMLSETEFSEFQQVMEQMKPLRGAVTSEDPYRSSTVTYALRTVKPFSPPYIPSFAPRLEVRP
ncbi:MAG: helix-turn-helix transcriptional regulator [Eubacteriales bacterium]